MKGERFFWVSAFAVLLGLLLAAGPVAAGTVNFDNIPTGPYVNLHTGGVTFSAPELLVKSDPAFAVTPPNVLFAAELVVIPLGTAYYPLITMVFDNPEFYVTFHELFFGANAIVVSNTINAIVAQAFDKTGTLVDQDRFFLSPPASGVYNFTGDRRVTLSADGITKVTFGAIISSTFEVSAGLSAEIDNLAFCPCTAESVPIPIPATFLLLGSGLLGMLGLSRKQKN